MVIDFRLQSIYFANSIAFWGILPPWFSPIIFNFNIQNSKFNDNFLLFYFCCYHQHLALIRFFTPVIHNYTLNFYACVCVIVALNIVAYLIFELNETTTTTIIPKRKRRRNDQRIYVMALLSILRAQCVISVWLL